MIRSCLVTAGPTRERIDPVRFISNYSTGTFGYALAREARRRGCRTTLISGPTALARPRGVRLVSVESALQMRDAVRREWKRHSCLIMAAAVADWRPLAPSARKIKRGTGPVTLRFVPNPDIVGGIRGSRKGKVVVGFALETDALKKNAAKKLKEKNLDMIVANRLGKTANVFGDGLTDVCLLDRRGGIRRYRGKKKAVLAKIILDKVLAFNI